MRDVVFRLTALWAFSECALGGLMHAFRLPFTGLFVGGFAVLCVGMLAHVSGRGASVILRATLLVVLAKAVVSPHSPPQAYLAVGFQGVLGALLLGYFRPYTLAALGYGVLAITESALQKLLMLYVFFGKPLFEAVDLFVADVLRKLGFQSELSWAWAIAGAYVGIYALWGAVLGYWIPHLPVLLERRARQYASLEEVEAPELAQSKRPAFYRKMAVLAGMLLFIAGTFLLTSAERGGGVQKALYAVARTLAVLALWLFVVRPLLQVFIRRWAKRRAEKESGALQQLLMALPTWRVRAGQLFAAVRRRYRGWRLWVEFALALLAVSLQEQQPVSVRDR